MASRSHTHGQALQPEADTARRRLFAAAVTAFGNRGFHGTTTRDIASAARMSPAALYVCYESKEVLLYTIARAGHQRIVEIVHGAVASSDSPASQLHRLSYGMSIYHAVRHTEARVINYELNCLEPDHFADIAAIRRWISAQVRELVIDGMRTGEFTCADAWITANAVLSLSVDVARWYRADLPTTPEVIASEYAQMALHIVGATGTRS